MSREEILELMRLKAWSRRDLADALDVGHNVVARWLMPAHDRTPGGPASRHMRLLLREARGEIRIVEVDKEAVPA